jgi:hypothetical protein
MGRIMSILSKHYWQEVFSPKDIIKTTLQTIVGTVLIGSFFMVASDYIFPTPSMHGRWEFTTMPDTALSKKHSVMQLTYTVVLFQEGNKIKATGEKTGAVVPVNNKGVNPVIDSYPPGKRVRTEILGYVSNNYFAPDEVTIFYNEGGANRNTSTIQTLSIIDENTLEGVFDSTISDSKGKVVWHRIR